MHMDLDYFFAQCEERENPSLKNKPVVVCVYSARGGDSGAVSTANYIARKYGVKAGIPIALAKRRLKERDAVFLPVNRELYETVSESIMGLLRGYADRFEQVSIDEAFLDVTQRVGGSFERAREIAQSIKEDILAKERLTCSVGIGPNKLIAKMAADFQKPNGLTLVKPEDVKSFLSGLPVDKLYGVGRKTEKRMLEMGIKTVGELAKYPLEDLVKAFGKTLGLYFHNASNGVDDEPVQERGMAESISRITTLRENTRDLNTILEDLYRLSEAIHERVVEQGLNFKSIGIVAIMEDLSIHTRSKTLSSPTDDLKVIRKTCRELLEGFLEKESSLQLRRIGVRVSGLTVGQRQLTEFTGTH